MYIYPPFVGNDGMIIAHDLKRWVDNPRSFSSFVGLPSSTLFYSQWRSCPDLPAPGSCLLCGLSSLLPTLLLCCYRRWKYLPGGLKSPETWDHISYCCLEWIQVQYPRSDMCTETHDPNNIIMHIHIVYSVHVHVVMG